MHFTDKVNYDKEDRKKIDHSSKDNSMLFNPDYRSPNSFYKTVYSNNDKSLEKSFNLNLN